MKIRLIPGGTPGTEEAPLQYLTTYLINDTLAIDGGSLGLLAPLEAQKKVRHVFLTHAHIDHLATLPIFLENVYDGSGDCPTIFALPEVLEVLQRDLFNGRIWPDFVSLSLREPPFLHLQALSPQSPIVLEGLRLIPVPVNHVVPTVGFLLEDDRGSVIIPSDTGPTDFIWDLGNLMGNVRAVFLEATFPNSMTWLAELSKHLTPELFARERIKLHGHARWHAVHLKPAFSAQVVRELQSLGLPQLEIVVPGRDYHV